MIICTVDHSEDVLDSLVDGQASLNKLLAKVDSVHQGILLAWTISGVDNPPS